MVGTKSIQFLILQLFEFNIRTIPEFDNEKVKSLFKTYLEEVNKQGGQLEEDLYLDLDPVLTTGDNPLIKIGQRVAKQIFGGYCRITNRWCNRCFQFIAR